MTTTEELAMAVVTSSILAHPRSQQTRIGPSEIGRPCDRWVLHKLAGDPEPPRGPAWKPAIGTALHSQMEDWFNAANPTAPGGDVSGWTWATEWPVNVGKIGNVDITGHSDLFHIPTGTVIDFKFIGNRQLAKYRLHGPSEQYRVQAMLYAKGFTDGNDWGPAHRTAIWFIPRDGELSQAYWWEAEYDPHIAAAALGRANRLWAMLQILGLDTALAACPVCDDPWCTWCRAERRQAARAAGGSLFTDESAPTPASPLAPVTNLFDH